MATKRTITKKVIPMPSGTAKVSVKEEIKTAEAEISKPSSSRDESRASTEGENERPFRKERSKRECFFCQSKTTPSYTDLTNLRRFLTDRAKIVGKERTGVCSKHQRGVTKNIKYARHLSLLPFVPKV